MKLVIGLGNPETRYLWTRHNTGFLVLDYYFKVKGLEWKTKPHLNAMWAKDGDVIFIKPQGYYNNSGRAVSAYMDYYKIPENDVLVILDDFNLEFGKVRYRVSGRAAGNNGLKSIIAELGHHEFPRIRVGTGNDELRSKLGDTDFVLSKFTPEEKAALPEVLDAAIERMEEVLAK
ncbi:aminoacyl-tRNA hydrolase [Candidatus Saccharibacteria bacterium]|nr:aminoacyl-tRNA hydrolase [Candidatus Saccharibacteria bacterium]